MGDQKKHDPLKPTGGDVAHLVTRAALSAVPVAGGPLVEFFAAIVAEPLSKRRDEWIRELAAELLALKERVEGLDPAQLAENDAFLTAVAHATQAASRTHQAEKRDALRNAVLNAAIGHAPGEDLQLVFLHLIDRFTPWHLKLLKFLQQPDRHDAAKAKAKTLMAGALAHVLEAVYPELVREREFCDLLVKDLRDAALTNTDSINGMMSQSGLLAKRTTDTGDLFLRFIERPPQG